MQTLKYGELNGLILTMIEKTHNTKYYRQNIIYIIHICFNAVFIAKSLKNNFTLLKKKKKGIGNSEWSKSLLIWGRVTGSECVV